MEMVLYLASVSLNGLKDSERDMITLKMIQGVGPHQLPIIWHELWKLTNWWPETTE
jgi:hypothetical protein